MVDNNPLSLRSLDIYTKFCDLYLGQFDNTEQVLINLQQKRKMQHPLTFQINRKINDQIFNNPDEIGCFFIQEIFLLAEQKQLSIQARIHYIKPYSDNSIQLITYQNPDDIRPDDFKAENFNFKADFNKLKLSHQFKEPIIYDHVVENNNNYVFKSEAVSQRSENGEVIKIQTKIDFDTFEVLESLYINEEKQTQQTDSILYKKKIQINNENTGNNNQQSKTNQNY